jgi:hypothetical protein
MRAPIRASSSWDITARRLACWSLFIFVCYWSAEWLSDHRGTLSQLSTLSAVPARVYRNFFPATRSFGSSAFKPQEQLLPNMGSQERNLDSLKEHLTYDKLEALRNFWFEHLPRDADRIIAGPEYQKRWFFSDKQFDDVCV